MVTKSARLTHAITVMHSVVKVMDLGTWQRQGGCKRRGGILPASRRKLHIKDFFFFYGWDGEHSIFVVEVRILCPGLLLLWCTSPVGMLFFPKRSRVCELLLPSLLLLVPEKLLSTGLKWKIEMGTKGDKVEILCILQFLGERAWLERKCWAEFWRDWGEG